MAYLRKISPIPPREVERVQKVRICFHINDDLVVYYIHAHPRNI